MPTEADTGESLYAVVDKHRNANVTSSVPRTVNTSDSASTSKQEVSTDPFTDVRVNDDNDSIEPYGQPSHASRRSYEPLRLSNDQLQQPPTRTRSYETWIAPGSSSSLTQYRGIGTIVEIIRVTMTMLFYGVGSYLYKSLLTSRRHLGIQSCSMDGTRTVFQFS